MRFGLKLFFILFVYITNSAFIIKRQNFHPIKTNDPDFKFYRSAVLKGKVLKKKIKKHDLDVVITFIGAKEDEIRVCKKKRC